MDYLKELEVQLSSSTEKLKSELRSMRSNRPSVELLEEVKVNYYEEWMTVKQLASLSITPPRTIVIQAWDKGAVGAIMKAIESANLGFTVSNDGNTIHATLSPLNDERREELSRVVKKQAEEIRIRIRSARDEAIKGIKSAEDKGKLTEDDVFSFKEKIQKSVEEANKKIEETVQGKLKEISE